MMADAADNLSSPAAAPDAPLLLLTGTLERRSVPGADAGRVRLLLTAQAHETAAAPRPALNLCLLLDRSGSMEGASLDAAKDACRSVVDKMGPDDFLGVAAFGDEADVVVPARRISHPALVKDYITRLEAGGRANLSEGLAAACGQVASVKNARTVNRVLLLSDGEPSAGARDAAGLAAQVQEQKARGIGVSTIGLGPDFPEDLLAQIARSGGGNFYAAPRPAALPALFGQEVDVLQKTVCRAVSLRLHLPRGVSVRRVYHFQPVFGPRTVEIALPDLEGGTSLSTLWELELAPRPAAPYRIAAAELLYEDAASGRPHRQTADVVLDFVDADAALPAPDVRVEAELAAARAALSLEETIRALSAGQIAPPAARAEAERVKADLLAGGRPAQARQAAQAVQDMDGGLPPGKALSVLAFQLGQGRARLT